jgi:hypothetical protein
MPLVPVVPTAELSNHASHSGRPRRRPDQARGNPVRDHARDGWTVPSAEPIVAHLHPRRRLIDDHATGVEVVSPRTRALLIDPNGPLLRQIASARIHGTVALAHPGAAIDADHLTGQVAATLEIASLPPCRLELILPESALIDLDTDGLLALSALRDLGVGLCIDAFGAGISSLTLLKRLPLTSLKLARSLVRAVPADREDATILHAVIATAHAIGLTVIADGIETERQRAFLAHSGCDEGQGPLFGPPIQITALPRSGILA